MFVCHASVVCCVHPVAVLNAEFCMTCSLLMLVEDDMGDHMEKAYPRDNVSETYLPSLITALVHFRIFSNNPVHCI